MINGFCLDKSRELDFYGLNEHPAPLFLAFLMAGPQPEIFRLH